jgi:hypothetical protein
MSKKKFQLHPWPAEIFGKNRKMTFQMPASSAVGLSRNCVNIKPLYGRGEGERRLEKTQTIGLNCGMTHSPGKIEYYCRYFIMTFRTQIHKIKFGKNDFHTLQGTMFHHPLTYSSSLKITAAYCTVCTVHRWKSRL